MRGIRAALPPERGTSAGVARLADLTVVGDVDARGHLALDRVLHGRLRAYRSCCSVRLTERGMAARISGQEPRRRGECHFADVAQVRGYVMGAGAAVCKPLAQGGQARSRTWTIRVVRQRGGPRTPQVR
jgi:hypothetical protein